MVKEEQQFYKLREVAVIIDKNKQTVWQYIKNGKIQGVRIGRDWKVSKAELERYLGHPVMSKTPIKEFLTTRDCGEILGYDMWTIRRYILDGINGLKLKAQKINGVWLVHKTDLDNFIKERMGN